jgi:4-amino-4-deoxy-L-arabinose transferase-like glycosyltransferase
MSMKEWITERSALASMGLIALIALMVQARFLDMPFIGVDAWRNSQTFSVGANFFDEGFNIFQPRYDLRALTDGRFPGEFPLLGSLQYIFYLIFGKSIFLARLISWALSLGSVVLLYKTLMNMSGSTKVAFFGVAMFATNPLLSRQSIAIMPEVLCNFLTLLALYFYLRINKEGPRFVGTLTLLILATLVKPQGYMLVAFFAYDFLRKPKYLISFLKVGSYIFAPLIVILIWKNYTLNFSKEAYGFHATYTHHYYRGLSHAVDDFSFYVIKRSLIKIFYNGFGISGCLFLLSFFVTKFFKERKELRDTLLDKYFLSSLGWLFLGFLFLLFAGNVGAGQTYYATAIALTSVVVLALLSKKMPRELLVFFVLFQFIFLYRSFSNYYFNLIPDWEDVRLNTHTDKFSSREKDLFLVWEGSRSNTVELVRMDRRGQNIYTYNALLENIDKYQFFYIKEKEYTPKLAAILPKMPIYKYKGNLFFDLNN